MAEEQHEALNLTQPQTPLLTNKLTIVEAIKLVLKDSPPISASAVYEQIVAHSLYRFGALDPKSVVRGQLRKHCLGLDFPSASPVKYFRLVGDDLYTLESIQGVKPGRTVVAQTKTGSLPEEVIDSAYREHLVQLRQELLEKILSNHPAFFETLVIELLIRMGYGASNPELGIHTGGPGDGGVDGIIKEDKLGLEQIYIQAKRYSLDREVKRTEVQRFAGAMNKVKKGVFITTARFAPTACSCAEEHEKTISLIDGNMLCDLMIMHGVGVSEVKTYRVLRVDSDYFSSSD